MKLVPHGGAEHYVIPIIYIWVRDLVPGNVKDMANGNDPASPGSGLCAWNFILVSVA